MTTLKTRKGWVSISTNLVRELPRFFGSFQSAIAEMFQNAYRARATSVIISYSDVSHTMIVSDNGPGCQPEKLLVAGESGWNDPKTATDPAGVGAFSLLRPEYVRSVTYECKGTWNWRMTLTEETLLGAPIEIEELEPAPGAGSGLTITLALKEDLKVTKEMAANAKGYYPFELIWMDDTGTIETITYTPPWEPQLTLDIPLVGKVELSYKMEYSSSQDHRVVWQCIPISSSHFHSALCKASATLSHPKLAGELVPPRIRLFVDPNSGVRAKLPDRNEVIEDDHLVQVATKIMQEILDRVVKYFAPKSKSWPDLLPDRYWSPFGPTNDIPADEVWLSYAWGRGDTRERILKVVGFSKIEYDDPTQLNSYETNDGDGDYLELESHCVVEFRRGKFPEVASEMLCTSLNMQGKVVRRSIKANADPNITITNLCIDPDNMWMAFADSIVVDGIGSVDYLIAIDEEEWEIPALLADPNFKQELTIIYAKPPIDFLGESHESLWCNAVAKRINHMLYLDDYGYIDYSYNEQSLHTTAIASDLEADALRSLGPHYSGMRNEAFELSEINADMSQKKRDLDYLVSRLKGIHHSKAASTTIVQQYEAALKVIEQVINDISIETTNLQNQTSPATILAASATRAPQTAGTTANP